MKKLGVLFIFVMLVQMAYAAHPISGFVEDALDGASAVGKTVIMWNPAVGMSDNLTDVVGSIGNYSIDCKLLSNSCIVNDIMSLKVIGATYVSWVVNVTVSGGSDVAGNLSLNSPPNASLDIPLDSGYVSGDVDFNCSFFDYDSNVARIGLWGNWSGAWAEKANVTSGFGNGYVNFNDILVQGSYEWNCYVEDALGIGSFAVSNSSFFVDTSLPVISDVSSVSGVCGFGTIAVNCSVYDLDSGVDSVIIQSSSPASDLVNYSASLISGDVYGVDVLMDSAGAWGLTCFVNDSVGNWNGSSGTPVAVSYVGVELGIVGDLVAFNVVPSVEGEVVNVSVNISNLGCVDSGDFVVGFNDGVSFLNATVSVVAGGFLDVSALWTTVIGLSNIFVYVDLDGDVSEDNESNNVGNGSIYLKAWQSIYGSIGLDWILGEGNSDMNLWADEASFAGNIFVADSEANVEWKSLQAIGRTKLGGISSGDFGEIDSALGMSSYNDSVGVVYGSGGTGNFSVFLQDIENVPFVNSSVNGNFVTGLLWDMSDSVDSEYDLGEGEDLVFVAKVNRGMAGSYGVYDYEISVPSKLREYDSNDKSVVYLYYDLR